MGDVDPVVFDQVQTWWPIARGGVSERFKRCRTRFLDEFIPFHVWLVDFGVFHRGGSRPEVVFRNGP